MAVGQKAQSHRVISPMAPLDVPVSVLSSLSCPEQVRVRGLVRLAYDDSIKSPRLEVTDARNEPDGSTQQSGVTSTVFVGRFGEHEVDKPVAACFTKSCGCRLCLW